MVQSRTWSRPFHSYFGCFHHLTESSASHYRIALQGLGCSSMGGLNIIPVHTYNSSSELASIKRRVCQYSTAFVSCANLLSEQEPSSTLSRNSTVFIAICSLSSYPRHPRLLSLSLSFFPVFRPLRRSPQPTSTETSIARQIPISTR